MFTGIIEEIGKIKEISRNSTSNKITIECKKVLAETDLGASIAVNGVCLTVVNLLQEGFIADVSPETSKVTTLNDLRVGDFVNLERAMGAKGRFGGHIVSGHIDGRGKCLNCVKQGEFYELNIELTLELSKYVIRKGSIAIDGISLTIAEIDNNSINVAIIPHTYENTNLKKLKRGDFVNIEVDMVAKYVEKFLSSSDNKSGISLEFLQEHGF